MDDADITRAFSDVFDQAVVFHGFTPYMRDYEVVLYAVSDPRTGIEPEHLRWRFRHCVVADVRSSVAPETWARSLDDRLTEHETGQDLDGYVWGVRWHLMYPGAKLVPGSTEARWWSDRIGVPMREATIETNAVTVRLVFADLVVDAVGEGYAPFVVTP